MPQILLTGQLKEKPTYRVWCLYSSSVHGVAGRAYWRSWVGGGGGGGAKSYGNDNDNQTFEKEGRGQIKTLERGGKEKVEHKGESDQIIRLIRSTLLHIYGLFV
jgi:hypothetical protein